MGTEGKTQQKSTLASVFYFAQTPRNPLRVLLNLFCTQLEGVTGQFKMLTGPDISYPNGAYYLGTADGTSPATVTLKVGTRSLLPVPFVLKGQAK